MCFSDLLEKLRAEGLVVTESQIRFAVRSGRITRPSRDGGGRFIWTEAIVAELVTHLSRTRQAVPA